ncbi:MAG: ABC transporter ATP-binding protein, partial [Desulfohalobiaceae bacterium]|nr:ABC transporter ATP-binding protein [Desulfohalobiaceae bacterium]
MKKGEIGCLLGPSGCGKTTLLKLIAGLESLDNGRLEIGGEVVDGGRIGIPPEKRGVGMVFQDYALFPHMTVGQNICFGLSKKKRKEQRQTVKAMLELVGLSGMQGRYPHELSGGQQQRVALARALAPSPRLLLLDEPFSSLDVSMRESLSLEVRDILKSQGITGLMVTHNQEEAFGMADMIGVMSHG